MQTQAAYDANARLHVGGYTDVLEYWRFFAVVERHFIQLQDLRGQFLHLRKPVINGR